MSNPSFLKTSNFCVHIMVLWWVALVPYSNGPRFESSLQSFHVGLQLSLVDLSGVYPVSCCMIAAVGSCIPDLDLKKWMAILCISNQKMLKFNKILILSSLAKLEENIKAFTELKDELIRIWSLSLFVYQGKIK